MASLSGMASGANDAFHGALDELSTLKDNILGGILSIPIVTTALTAAANIIIMVNILKIIKKLPTKISGLQTELLTIAGFAVGSAAYTKALEGLEKSELGKTMISAGHDIANLANTTRDIVNTTTDAAARARGIARNTPNFVFNTFTGAVTEVAQGTLLSGEDAESEPPLDKIPINEKMKALRELNSDEAQAAFRTAAGERASRMRFEQWYAANQGSSDDPLEIRIMYNQ